MASRGRPTDYNADVQALADAYVDGGFVECGDVVPSVAGLAVELGANRDTMYAWRDAHQDFSDTLARMLFIQERLSLSGGLNGSLNSTIVKLLLANHGYSDRQALDHSSRDGSMTPTAITLTGPSDSDTP